jgi:hypothetical protein
MSSQQKDDSSLKTFIGQDLNEDAPT